MTHLTLYGKNINFSGSLTNDNFVAGFFQMSVHLKSKRSIGHLWLHGCLGYRSSLLPSLRNGQRTNM